MLSREVSVLILTEVFKNLSLEEAINKNGHFKNLTSKEQSFVRMTLLTYLRRHGEIDKIIKIYLKKKN